MRTIPPYIDSGFKNRGERMLFDRLKMLRSESYFAIHSLNLPDHAYKATGEIDFLLLGPRGLYVLEVKGGQVSSHSGVWTYEDRWLNRRTSSEGPFAQAASAMYALRERLKNLVSHSDLNSLVMGYGVVFPDCIFDVSSVEWDPELILDASDWSDRGIENYLHTLEDYWLNKFPDKPRSSDPQRIERLLSALRPEFDLVRSLNVEAMAIEARLVSMTDEQYARLDMIDHCPRILIEGGAGTGKTFIASALASRYASEGKKVLFLCYSPLLAGYLKKQVGSSGATITSVHQLMLDTVIRFASHPPGYYPGMPLTDPWYRTVLLPAFLQATEKLADSDRYDILLLDEAQDILNMEYLAALDRFLLHGIEQGTWRVFLDSCNQASIFGMADSEAIQYLRSLGPVPPRLTINCRNTDEIVTRTKLITGADLANKSTGPGPEVELQYYKNQLEAARQVENYLDQLERQDCRPTEITILSPLPFTESCVSKMSAAWKSRLFALRGTTSETFPHPRITFSTVASFKGLENRHILLVDIDDYPGLPDIQSILYVGMTRARVKLWISIAGSFRDTLDNQINQNLHRLLQGTDHDR